MPHTRKPTRDARVRSRRTARSPKKKAPPRRSVAHPKSPRPAALQRKATRRTGPKRRIAASRLRDHAAEVYRRLAALYPDAHCELDYQDAWQLLIATILSAQCTDKRVNMVTPRFFATYPTPDSLAAARQEDVEEIIKSTGFFRNKARSLIGMANALVNSHGGLVPARLDEMVTLPGVGRKTANVVLGNALDVHEGVVVDTHVQRVGARLGLTRESDPVRIEQDLMRLYPREQWTMLSHLLIWHGRRICDARRPKCEMCTLNDICPSSLV